MFLQWSMELTNILLRLHRWHSSLSGSHVVFWVVCWVLRVQTSYGKILFIDPQIVHKCEWGVLNKKWHVHATISKVFHENSRNICMYFWYIIRVVSVGLIPTYPTVCVCSSKVVKKRLRYELPCRIADLSETTRSTRGDPRDIVANFRTPKLWNGTKLIVKALHRKIAAATILTGCTPS